MSALSILWAQGRAWRNWLFRGRPGRRLMALALFLIWYASWGAIALWLARVAASTPDPNALNRLLARALLFVSLYWQLIRMLALAAGAGLDFKRLLVYPVRAGRLFFVELAVRLLASLEMLLVVGGASAGLMRHPGAAPQSMAALALFAAINLFLAVGLCRLFERLLARRYVREAAFLGLVLAAALPQVALARASPETLAPWLALATRSWWPWAAAAEAALGGGSMAWLVLALWAAGALAFARFEFHRALGFDTAESLARHKRLRQEQESLPRRWLRRTMRPLRDPVAALVEKELLVLGRSPRFRLVFIMGFTFGLLVWLPLLAAGGAERRPQIAAEYLALVSAYALLLLGESTFWNAFAFDRAAAQLYFLAPSALPPVILGKNVAAVVAVLAEVTLVAIACALFGMPVSGRKVAEAYAVTLVLSLYLFAAGNLASVYYPRPADPQAPWRSAGRSRFQALLLVAFPVLALPASGAYLLRWAFEREAAFFAGLAGAALLGAALYRRSVRLTASLLTKRREAFLEELRGRGEPELT
jgi:ABC-2 type transport system permease protein